MLNRPWSRLLIHPHGVEGAHDFLENSAITDLIGQAKGEPGQALAQTYLQLPLRQWGAGNVYLLVLSSWKVNIAKNSIAVLEL